MEREIRDSDTRPISLSNARPPLPQDAGVMSLTCGRESDSVRRPPTAVTHPIADRTSTQVSASNQEDTCSERVWQHLALLVEKRAYFWILDSVNRRAYECM